jgi:hypothetical protein
VLTSFEENTRVALRLEEVARLLEAQGANPYRVEAYRHGATTVLSLKEPINQFVDHVGIEGLQQLPGIGRHLAQAIYHITKTGELPMLERIRHKSDPVNLIATVPGIGHHLAEKIHRDLGIDSLEELEAAAYDGRLRNIEAFGEKRLAGIRDSLATRLGRIRRLTTDAQPARPSVGEILQIDREYREKSDKGLLTKIAPRRFNPEQIAWLPILHNSHGIWHYSALFSNTPLAHQMNKTHDWVVIYYDNGKFEGQATVVTAYKGILTGKRIVRGRETECEMYYRKMKQDLNLPSELTQHSQLLGRSE